MISQNYMKDFFDTTKAFQSLSELLNVENEDIEEKLDVMEKHIKKLRYVYDNHEDMIPKVMMMIDKLRYRGGIVENYNLH